MKRRKTMLLSALLVAYALLWAVLSFSHSTLQLPVPATDITISSQADHNLASIVGQLHRLQSDNEELNLKVAKLQEKVSETYPSEIEKETADLSSLATFLTIALTLAALLVSLVSLERVQKAIRNASRQEAIRIVKSRSDFLQGLVDFTTGFVLGKVAWNNKEHYRPTDVNYVVDVSERHLEVAYQYSRRHAEHEFQEDMNQLSSFALNNLIFYSTLNPKSAYHSKIPAYLVELEASPQFRLKSTWMNTYCRAALKFLVPVAREQKKSEREMLQHLEEICAHQKRLPLTEGSRRELENIKEKLTRELEFRNNS